MKLTEQAIAELKALEDGRGRLTPEQVVEAARPAESALHACFTWNNSEAAERWRIEEARELIRSVRIEVTVEDRPIRSIAYVRDPERAGNAPGYVALMRVRKKSAGDLMRDELTAIAELCARVLNIIEARPEEYGQHKADIAGIKARVESIIDAV